MTSFKPSPEFYNAASFMTSSSAPSDLSNNQKLELYGVYKFITEGAGPKTSRPSIFDITGRAKWDSWKSLSTKYSGKEAEAQDRYISIATECGWVQDKGTSVNQAPVQEEEPSAEELLARDAPERSSGVGTGAVVSTVSLEDQNIDEQSLHGLAIKGDPKKLEQYLEDNPETDLNAVDEFGYTAVHLACDRGHEDIVQVLLEHGADISIKDQDDLTAEELASEAGYENIVSILRKDKSAGTLS
ncbi:ankyrin [Schizopora paradoxa]|uniref:Ankyrin n=1 Tax=Schizopora paradoxa TaxID=27342 RepID=A0A0H2RRL2_9AGAM|nr:ankyrin [Schizopora paradoxa]